MGNRLSKIYTKTGDDGTTGLGDGTRVDKDGVRVEAYGTVDEANSAIGIVLAHDGVPDAVRECLERVQHDLFDVGGELCVPGMRIIGADRTVRIESELDAFNETLPALKEFILPGGSPAAAACHLARTVCRRAERRIITLARAEPVDAELIRYMNRLSDLLFVVARVLARHKGASEVMWRSGRNPDA